MKELVKGLVTKLPSSFGTGIGDVEIPVGPRTEVGHGTGTGAEDVPVVSRPSSEEARPDHGTGPGAEGVPVAPRSGGVAEMGISEAVLKKTAAKIEEITATDSDEELGT